MNDTEIIRFYWDRNPEAITQTEIKYGRLCRHIAMNILTNSEDAEECVNDTYLGAWNAIPPQKPESLSAFLSKITRNLSLKRADYNNAQKRSRRLTESLDELAGCVSGGSYIESELENRRIEECLSSFLWQQTAECRNVFLRRYWYFDSIADISERYGIGRSKIATMLHRTRNKLRDYMQKEGIDI